VIHCRIRLCMKSGGTAARRHWRAGAGLCVGTHARHKRAATGSQRDPVLVIAKRPERVRPRGQNDLRLNAALAHDRG
jgi:hypothetical protein